MIIGYCNFIKADKKKLNDYVACLYPEGILNLKEIFYNPIIREETAYIKTEHGVKKVLAFYIKEAEIVNGGD